METPTATPTKTIHRRKLVADFTVLPNALLRDKTLSFRARGVAAMMLSNADGWVTNMGWIESQGTEGREAVRAAMQELEAGGYAVFELQKDSAGTITANLWTWFDLPVTKERRTNRTRWTDAGISKSSDAPCDGNPLHGHRETGLPCDGFPSDGKPAAKKNQVKKDNTRKKDQGDAGAPIGEFPKAAIRETWNRLVPSLTKITGINGKRERAMHARWQAIGDLASWEQFCIRVEASDFMTGRQAGTDGRKWTATFDWCIIPGNFDKVVEGRYDNQKPNPKDKNGNKSWMF